MGKDLAGKVVQGGKESHRPMSIVIMGSGADVSLAQRQAGLGALQGLAPVLFITAEHQGPLRRIEVEAHHVPELFLKVVILGELEIAHPMGLQLMGRPESLYARFAQAVSRAIVRALQGPACAPDSRPVRRPSPKAPVSLPLPGASWSPSKPLAAQRFLHRPMAKRLTDWSSEISW